VFGGKADLVDDGVMTGNGFRDRSQHTFLFNAAVVSAYILARLWRRRGLSASRFAALALCFFAGLLPYAYLPVASRRNAAFSWGDITSVHGFVVRALPVSCHASPLWCVDLPCCGFGTSFWERKALHYTDEFQPRTAGALSPSRVWHLPALLGSLSFHLPIHL